MRVCTTPAVPLSSKTSIESIIVTGLEPFKPYPFYIGLSFHYYMPVTTAITKASEETGTMLAQTNSDTGLKIRELKAEDGETKNIIEGYAATTHVDQTNDEFTRDALENMAKKIRGDSEATVDAVFPEIEGMDESEIGNVNHNNNPAAEKLLGAGDTRTVSVFRTVHAEVRTLPDNESALFIRGEMLPLPDNVEDAVKGQIKQGALHSFSIEFNPTDVEYDMKDGEPVRRIRMAEPQGNALTGRPMNQNAEVTDAELKNILGEAVKETDEYRDQVNAKTEDTNMTEEDTPEQSEEEEPEVENPDEPETPEPEEGDEPDQGDEDEDVEDAASELKSEVQELKTMFSDLKTENEELKEENKELKAKLEDAETIGEVKSEVSELKSEIEDSDADLEGDRPLQDQNEEREVKSGSDKSEWKKEIDQLGLGEQELKSKMGKKGMTRAEMISEQHDVQEEQVMEYVN